LKTIDSRELKRLEELRVLTASTEFTDRVAYLKDRKRFLKSEDSKRILEYNESDKSSFMAAFRKLKKAKELDFFKEWEIIFEENFTDKKLNTEIWQHENWWGHHHVGTSFSQEGEKQGYHGIKNIELNNNTLAILSKKERAQGSVWNPAVGILPKQFEYTSSILNSAGSFRLKEGVVEAKVRFRKDTSIVCAFSLTGENPFPQIDLFRSTKNGFGLGIVEKSGAVSTKYEKFNGHNDQHYHIFRLELFGNELVWKINGAEVYRNTTHLKEPLFFHILTSLHGEVNEQLLPHRFEIDWIRCLARKN
jgi:beta-glucanase (GH16 family)